MPNFPFSSRDLCTLSRVFAPKSSAIDFPAFITRALYMYQFMVVVLFPPRISVIAFLQQFHPIFFTHVSSFPFFCTFGFQCTSSSSRFTRIYLFPCSMESFLLFISYLSGFYITHILFISTISSFFFFFLFYFFLSFVLLLMRDLLYIFTRCANYILSLFYNKSTFLLLRSSLDSLTLQCNSLHVSAIHFHHWLSLELFEIFTNKRTVRFICFTDPIGDYANSHNLLKYLHVPRFPGY